MQHHGVNTVVSSAYLSLSIHSLLERERGTIFALNYRCQQVVREHNHCIEYLVQDFTRAFVNTGEHEAAAKGWARPVLFVAGTSAAQLQHRKEKNARAYAQRAGAGQPAAAENVARDNLNVAL